MKRESPSAEGHKDHIVLGMMAGAGAIFMLSVMVVFAKLLSERHAAVEIAFYRNLIASLPFLFMILVMGKRDFLVVKSKPLAVGARAVIGAASLVTTFAAFAAMPMADTQAFLFTSSLFIPVMGIIFLGESVGPYRWAAVVFGFIGVLIMLQPGGETNVVGVTLAMSAAFMHAVLQTILRFLGKFERPETVTFYFVVVGTLVTALALPFVAVKPTLAEIPLLLGLGFSGLAGQFLLSVAFSKAPAAVVTVFNYSGIVWATFFGWLLWDDWPALVIWIGGSVVIFSNLFLVWREARLGRVTGARVRAKL
ncbi:MAG: DMT family transporter [Pseudomonadota bacterium]